MDLSYWLHLRTLDSGLVVAGQPIFLSKGTCFIFKVAVESYPATYSVLMLKTVKSLSEVVHARYVYHPQLYKVSDFELSETLEVRISPSAFFL